MPNQRYGEFVFGQPCALLRDRAFELNIDDTGDETLYDFVNEYRNIRVDVMDLAGMCVDAVHAEGRVMFNGVNLLGLSVRDFVNIMPSKNWKIDGSYPIGDEDQLVLRFDGLGIMAWVSPERRVVSMDMWDDIALEEDE